MTTKTNPLAVMDSLATTYRELSAPNTARVILEARAAMAELVEAAMDVSQTIHATCANDEKWLDRLRAALAAFEVTP